LNRLLKRIDEPIAAILTLNTIAHTVGAAMGGAIALEVFGEGWIVCGSGDKPTPPKQLRSLPSSVHRG
jgi:hypothetical protein